MFIQNLRTDNDRNGNPRRLWAVYAIDEDTHTARTAAFVDEGYLGRQCLLSVLTQAEYDAAIELPAADIIAKEYNTRKRARS